MEIREASIFDQDKIIEFIREYWDSNHIFVKSPDLFTYQYGEGEQIHFILGIDNNEIAAILGYIPYSQELEHKDIFLAMWMTNPNVKNGNIGLQLNKYLLDQGYRSVSCCGIAKKVKPLYQFLGYTTGTLSHFYMLNHEKEHFKIANVVNNVTSKVAKVSGVNLLPILEYGELTNLFTLENFKERLFYKDKDYIQKRYYNHPFYNYVVYGIESNAVVTSILITRAITIDGAKVLRVIDFIGDEQDLGKIGYELQELMTREDYEFIDFYQYGINAETLIKSGFTEREKKDVNTIPNYYEPFEKKNVDIHFSTNVKGENYYIFKGDGDQDRPNLLPGEKTQ